MDKKRAIVIVALLVVAVGAWALISRLNSVKVDPVLAEQFQWKISDLGMDPIATTTAISSIVLTVAGVDVPIGTYQGACNLIDNDKTKLLAGEVSGVICTMHGKGQEIGIFTEGDKLSLKQGEVINGDNGQTRNNFTELKKL